MLRVLWILGAAIGCGGASEEEPPAAPEIPPTALDDAAFRFCHTDGANAEDARAWCGMLDDLPPERCPGLRATCAGAETEDPVGCESLTEGVGRARDLAAAPDRPPEQLGCDSMTGCEAFDATGLQQLVRWVAALLVAALVLVVLRLAWASFGRGRRPAPLRPASGPAPEALDTLEDVPDVPSDDLLDQARRALTAGRYAEAVLFARAAALRRLGDAGRIRLHRSRTDREYVRSIRSEPPLHGDLRAVVDGVEAVRWAGHPIGAERAERVVDAAERLVRAVPVRAALVALWLGAFGGSDQALAQSYERYAPDGDAALLEVLELHGYEATWRLRNLADLDGEVDVLILDLTALEPVPEHWERIDAWVDEGGVLVVGGDASTPFPALGAAVPAPTPHEVHPDFAAAGLPVPRWPDGEVTGWDGAELRWIVRSADGPAPVAVLDHGAGVVVAIADARLLWNGSFVDPANEQFIGGLVYAGQGLEGWPVATPARVQLATWGSVGEPQQDSQGCNNPADSLARAGLFAFLLQLAITWGLAGLWRGLPFAPLRDPRGEERASFSDHLVALGTRYWRLRAEGHAARASAALWAARLGPHGLELAAQRGGASPAEARAWALRIEAVARRAPDDDTPVDPALMEELWRLTRREP